jgi:hypothetical protein
MTPDKHKLLIDQLDKSLSDPSGQAQDDSLGNDPETVKENQILGVALEAIRYSGLTQQVKSVREELAAKKSAQASEILPTIPSYIRKTAPTPSVHRFITNAMKVAAVLVLAVSLTGLGKFILTNPSGVYDKFYSPYVMSTTRGSAVPNSVEQAYQAKDWSGVVNAFESNATKTGKDYFLTAMACMEQKKFDQAIELFKTLIQTDQVTREPYFQDEAEYYLAMSYLANHQGSLAVPILTKIKADPHHLFNKKVKEMSDVDMLILRAK